MTEPHDQHDDTTDTDGQRRPYRPPVGMPLRGEGRWGAPFSLALHVVLILLLITPLFARVIAPELFPGGGLGPAGGGGGGRGGFGGWRRPEPITPDKLRYMRLAPEPPPSETVEPAAEAVPVPKEVTPPPQPDPPAPQAPPEQSAPAAAPQPGTGGGTGNDGTSGTGPGTGGGVGSGVGTGTGSANGPGTGGGEGRDFLPTPDMLVLAPEPRPGRVRGKAVTITFSLNERGEILRIDFESTGDRGYDRRLRERMNEMRFRPAVGPDGRPIAATFPVTVQL
jgi:periplasmic protein TonB